MFNSKIKKGQQGFTLVEVIVVAIIVAALAAVAVPLYLSYVDSSRRNSAANAAGSVASFAGSCRNSGGTISLVGTPPTSVTCSSNTSTIQIPAGITIFNTAPASATAAGAIDGCHSSFDCTSAANKSTYNY